MRNHNPELTRFLAAHEAVRFCPERAPDEIREIMLGRHNGSRNGTACRFREQRLKTYQRDGLRP
jgi:hypothetical protein